MKIRDQEFYGTVQVAAPWHIKNVPITGLVLVPMQFVSELLNDHVPTTTPFVRVPVVPVVPFEVPVRPFALVRVKTVPAVVWEVTV